MSKKEVIIMDTPYPLLELSSYIVEKIDSFLIQEIFEESLVITRGRVFNPIANEKEFEELVKVLLKHKGKVYTEQNLTTILIYVNLTIKHMLEYFTDSEIIMAEYIIESINGQIIELRKVQ